MKPIYRGERAVLYHGDALEVMALIAQGFIGKKLTYKELIKVRAHD